MTWDAYHRRKGLLRDILAIADRDRGFALTDLLNTLDPDRLVFADETEALFEIQMAWFQRLSGHVERIMVDGAETPEMVAVAAWAATAADLPGARALLDADHDAPAMAVAFANERAFLAASAGVPSNHPDVSAHGERIISSARAEAATSAATPAEGHEAPSFMTRLRNAIAA